MIQLPLLLAALATVPLPQNSDRTEAVRDIETLCNRAQDASRPAAVAELTTRLAQESGARVSFLRGCEQLAKQEWGRAGAEFERATKADPLNAVYHFWFGRATGEQAQRANVLRQPGLARRTKGEFERAVELDSAYIPGREGLLRFYLAAPGMFGGSVDRAREQAEAIAVLNPYRGGMARANVAFAAKDTAALIRTHEGLSREYPDSVTPWSSLVNVHSAMRNWPAAWAALDGLQRARPALPTARYAAGRIAAESGQQLDRGEAALRAYLGHTPLPNEPSHAAAHWRLGLIAEHRGQPDEARAAYETALRLDPKFAQAKDALARIR